MQRLQAYRFELMPNGQQQRAMRSFAGSCRYVYNQALHLQQERYKAGEKKLGYAGLCKVLTAWKKQAETDWLNNTPGQALQQALTGSHAPAWEEITATLYAIQPRSWATANLVAHQTLFSRRFDPSGSICKRHGHRQPARWR